MMKEQFLQELADRLKPLPQHVREDILYDYEEHFSIALEEGKSEDAIIRKLGSPKAIARELLAQEKIEKAQAEPSVSNFFRAAFTVIGLSFMNLILVLGPLIAVFSVVVSLFVSAFAFIISPIAALMGMIFGGSTIIDFFASVAFAGIGIFLLIGMLYASKWLGKVFVAYLKWNIRLVRGESL